MVIASLVFKYENNYEVSIKYLLLLLLTINADLFLKIFFLMLSKKCLYPFNFKMLGNKSLHEPSIYL